MSDEFSNWYIYIRLEKRYENHSTTISKFFQLRIQLLLDALGTIIYCTFWSKHSINHHKSNRIHLRTSCYTNACTRALLIHLVEKKAKEEKKIITSYYTIHSAFTSSIVIYHHLLATSLSFLCVYFFHSRSFDDNVPEVYVINSLVSSKIYLHHRKIVRLKRRPCLHRYK